MDASNIKIGIVLMLNDHPIVYFSKKLNGQIANTLTYLKELYTIIEVVFKWR